MGSVRGRVCVYTVYSLLACILIAFKPVSMWPVSRVSLPGNHLHTLTGHMLTGLNAIKIHANRLYTHTHTCVCVCVWCVEVVPREKLVPEGR